MYSLKPASYIILILIDPPACKNYLTGIIVVTTDTRYPMAWMTSVQYGRTLPVNNNSNNLTTNKTMKTNALKIAVAAACFAFSVSACSSNSGRNADQEGDTTMTDTANNTQIEGTDTGTVDTSVSGSIPGGAVGPEGQGTSTDTSSKSNTPAP